MTYFAVLGNYPELSIAELMAYFNNQLAGIERPDKGVLIFNLAKEIDCQFTIGQLGGTIKLGRIATTTNLKNIFEDVKTLLNPGDNKYNFGISTYGPTGLQIKTFGMQIKQYLKSLNKSCRFVVSQEKNLSSVVVEQNHLLDNGIELNLIAKNNKLYLGQTLAVQPFKTLSFRDYGRPARDDRSGMLPPKLAQIMINLANTDKAKTILDPFCGSGTILTEAILMNYKNLIGSDISPKAIADSQTNLDWIKQKFSLKAINCQLINLDATKLNQKLKSNSVGTIITEPYLGPQRGQIKIKETVQELTNLYEKSLETFYNLLEVKGKIIMIWPIILDSLRKNYLPINLKNKFKIINSLPEELSNKNNLSPRSGFIYGRPEQRVWREIVVLEKI